MTLTVGDLIKIEKLLEKVVGNRLTTLEKGQTKIRKEIIEMKDDIVSIRKELDTEHVLRHKQIERNRKDIDIIKTHLQLT